MRQNVQQNREYRAATYGAQRGVQWRRPWGTKGQVVGQSGGAQRSKLWGRAWGRTGERRGVGCAAETDKPWGRKGSTEQQDVGHRRAACGAQCGAQCGARHGAQNTGQVVGQNRARRGADAEQSDKDVGQTDPDAGQTPPACGAEKSKLWGAIWGREGQAVGQNVGRSGAGCGSRQRSPVWHRRDPKSPLVGRPWG